MLKQEYSICVTPFCSTMLQTPPSPLFLVFMITKITTGFISWESERLWATLQEWHCSSVYKFLRSKIYITVHTASTVKYHLTTYTHVMRYHLFFKKTPVPALLQQKLTICFRCKILNVFLIWFITYAKSWLHANRQPLIRMNWKTNFFFPLNAKQKG